MSTNQEILFTNYTIDSLMPGMNVSCSRLITDQMVREFSEISGDSNPVHLDEEYAAGTRFKRKIAHGLMSASFFSSLFGTKMPGEGCVYASQSLRFRRPVYIGDTVEATVTVRSIDVAKKRVVFDTVCLVKNKVVIDGSAEIFIP